MKRLFAALMLTTPLVLDAEAATVAPHRAVYDLTLSRAGDGATLASAQGRLAFEIQGSACEGWTVNFRMATRYQPAAGDGNLVDTRSTTYEAADGLEFRHQITELINGEVKQDQRIAVNRASRDKEGDGTIHGQDDSTFSLPGGTKFPMEHQLRLMDLGAAGGGRDSSVIFDGSDGSKAFSVISFVGKAKPPGSIARDIANPEAAPLKGLSAWPMTISYFPETGGEEVPDYQVSFDMYENGVATGVLLDYGSFALTGTLKKLEMLKVSPCP